MVPQEEWWLHKLNNQWLQLLHRTNNPQLLAQLMQFQILLDGTKKQLMKVVKENLKFSSVVEDLCTKKHVLQLISFKKQVMELLWSKLMSQLMKLQLILSISQKNFSDLNIIKRNKNKFMIIPNSLKLYHVFFLLLFVLGLTSS